MQKIINFWSQKKILNYVSKNRSKYSDLYFGEKILLKKYLKNNYSILDIGCSQGGLVSILNKMNLNFKYVGVDYNKKILSLAKKKYPKQKFIEIKDNEYSKYLKKKFDLVIIFGILHLNNKWKKIIKEAYKLTEKYLIFDLRETDKSIKEKILMKLDGDKKSIPYIIHKEEVVKKLLKKVAKNKKIVKVSYKGFPTKFSNYKSEIIFSNYCLYK